MRSKTKLSKFGTGLKAAIRKEKELEMALNRLYREAQTEKIKKVLRELLLLEEMNEALLVSIKFGVV